MASMAEYLKRYTESGVVAGDAEKKKKKKKKKESVKAVAGGVKIFDDDVKWQKEVKEESDEDEPDVGPQVETDVEFRRMQRLEEIKAHRPYLKLGDDGSGWVTVEDDKAKGGRPGYDQDLSPPRKVSRHDSPDLSPPRRGAQNDSPDLSPPRRARNISPDLSPPRKVRHDSPDQSPLRRARRDSPDLPPPRKARNDIPDLSPRRRARHDSPDLSPPRRARHDSPDLRPPRKSRHDSPDLSPPRRARRDSPDLPPPRRARNESPDLSPPRRARHDSPDLSPPRKARHDSPDLPPPRRTRHDSPDLLPSRKRQAVSPSPKSRQKSADISPPQRGGLGSKSEAGGEAQFPGRQDEASGEGAPKGGPVRMTDGTLAGLRTGREVMVELEQKRRDDAVRFAQLDATVTGRGAQTVYRDKQGKKTNLEQIMEESMAKKKKELPPAVWAKGLAQSRVAAEAAEALAAAAEQPFAQYETDSVHDKQLKERIRWGDPMAHLVKAKPEAEFADLSSNVALVESGFKIPQEVPPHSWIKRRVGMPANRFGIRPGRHWDGVDRSTGFEKQMFKMQNEREAQDKEAYLWSVADM